MFKTSVLYFVCTMLFGAGTVAAALPICLFSFTALKAFVPFPHPDALLPDTPKNRKNAVAARYIKAFSLISLGFIVSEAFTLIAVILTRQSDFISVSLSFILPIPLYLVALSSVAAACSHMPDFDEKGRKLLCALTPLLTVFVAIVLGRA